MDKKTTSKKKPAKKTTTRKKTTTARKPRTTTARTSTKKTTKAKVEKVVVEAEVKVAKRKTTKVEAKKKTEAKTATRSRKKSSSRNSTRSNKNTKAVEPQKEIQQAAPKKVEAVKEKVNHKPNHHQHTNSNNNSNANNKVNTTSSKNNSQNFSSNQKSSNNDSTVTINQNVAILIDGNNIEKSIHSLFNRKSAMLDFDNIIPKLLRKRGLNRLIYFREGLHISSKLAERLHKNYFGTVVPCHKSADIPLSITATQLAEKVDTIIILSGDSDYVDLVRHLRSRGVRVEIAAIKQTTAKILIDEADFFTEITKTDCYVR